MLAIAELPNLGRKHYGATPHTKNSLVLIKGPQLIVGMRWNHARNFF